MVITGIQVIRGNLAAPDARDTAVGVLPGQPIELTYGDRLHVGVSFDYQGPQMSVTLYGAIGTRGFAGFDEIIAAENPIPLPDSLLNFVPVTGALEIPITADIAPGEKYDLYVKISEYPGAGMPQVDDVITITGIPPTFKLLEETIYPYAYVYDGKCEVATFTATSIPFTPSSWVSGKMAAAVEAEVRKAGGRIMEMRVYVDENLLRPWTNWRIEVVTRPQTTGTAMSLGAWWLGPAIILALLTIIVIATPFAIKAIAGLFKRNPALKDVKPAWKKETLILTIQDAEEYWKRTPTPVATLEGMSEEELRAYLDKIAEEEVKPPAAGLGLALAAVGVLALGGIAVAAYAMSQPKEKEKR